MHMGEYDCCLRKCALYRLALLIDFRWTKHCALVDIKPEKNDAREQRCLQFVKEYLEEHSDRMRFNES